MRLVRLPANQPPGRFYRGGRKIVAFRGEGTFEEFTPEDWVGSVTAVFGQSPLGMTRLDDGELLADAIATDPVEWLGARHVAMHGADTLLLVKLLDAGQRLPVHAHPDDAFAASHLGRAHGKAEAWYVLEPGTVHLGLTVPLARHDLQSLIAEQRVDTLLETMNRIDVAPGDTVFVPPGTLHSIGEGTFVVEVQQPEDLSILLEWRGFDIDGSVDGHLGLGFDVATQALDLSPMTVDGLVVRSAGPGQTLAPASSPYFRLELAAAGSHHDAGFAVAIAHAGPVRLRGADSEDTLPAGSTTLVPYAYGDVDVLEGAVLLAKPPLLHG